MTRSTLMAASLLAALLAPAHAETKGPVTDDLGVIEIAKGEPIQIGSYLVLSGSDTSNGVDQQRGVEIAFADKNNMIAGHPVRLSFEDSQCSAEGGQTAATKLSTISNLVLVIGPSCSSEATAGAPILWEQGIASIGTSTSAPRLTDPQRAPEFNGFLRTSYNDLDVGRSTAEWIFTELGLKTAATLHDGSVYTEQLATVFAARFEELGGKITNKEAIAPTDIDLRPVLTRIASSAPQALFAPIYVSSMGHLVRQSTEVPGLDKSMIIASDAVLTQEMLTAGGDSTVGLRVISSALEPDALGKGYANFVKKYEETYGEKPIQATHHQAYDAAAIGIAAIEAVAETDAEGNLFIGKKALRDALFATRDHQGLTGTLNCTKFGDCGHFNFAVYQFTDAAPGSYVPGTNPKRIYP